MDLALSSVGSNQPSPQWKKLKKQKDSFPVVPKSKPTKPAPKARTPSLQLLTLSHQPGGAASLRQWRRESPLSSLPPKRRNNFLHEPSGPPSSRRPPPIMIHEKLRRAIELRSFSYKCQNFASSLRLQLVKAEDYRLVTATLKENNVKSSKSQESGSPIRSSSSTDAF